MALSTFYYSNGSSTTSSDTIINQSSYDRVLNLTGVNIGDGVTVIDNNAFFSRQSLININIPNSVVTIGYSAFRFCYALKNFIIPNQMELINSETFSDCRSLTTIIIPNNIKNIGFSAFYNCGLTNVNISNGIETIGIGAFSTCQNLTNINIPKSVINISEAAFYNCTNLNTVNIGNVINIGNDVFRNCSQLTKINFLENAPFSLGTNVFLNTDSNLKIYRYSTKSGWSSTFGGVNVLLIDSPIDQGLQSFAFPNISSGKASVKKINLGRGKLSLVNEIVPSLGLSLWLKADEGVTYTSQSDGPQIVIIDLTGYMGGRYIREGFPEPDISFWMYAGGSAYIYYDSNVGKFYLKDTDRLDWDINIAESTDGVNWTSYYQLPTSITINGCTGDEYDANGTYSLFAFYGPDNEYTYYYSSNSRDWRIIGNPLTGWRLEEIGLPVFRVLCTNSTQTATGLWTNLNVTGTVTSTSSLFPNRSGTVYFTQEGYNVTSWKDNSGKGRDASQILGFAPLYLTDILNGKPVISFDNNNLFSENQNLNKDSTIFVVVIPTNNNASLVSTNTNGLFFSLSASPENSLKVGINNIEIANDNQINNDAMIISTIRSNNLNSKIYKDGTFVTQGNYNTSSLNPVNQLILGGSGGSQIAEILIYNVALNDKKLQKLNSYLSKKYAIDLQAISYNSGGANPLEYSGKGLVNNHFIGGLYGSGETDPTTWTTTFKILKKGILYYSFNLESSAGHDYASSTLNSNIIFEEQTGFIQSNGNINVDINDIITITYSKDGSGESAGFDGIRFNFYIV